MDDVKSATPSAPPYRENEYEANTSNNYNYTSTINDIKTINLKEILDFIRR